MEDPDFSLIFRDVVILFAAPAPKSGDLPRDLLFILSRSLTVPGPAESPRRPKTAKKMSIAFFSRRGEVWDLRTSILPVLKVGSKSVPGPQTGSIRAGFSTADRFFVGPGADTGLQTPKIVMSLA